MLGRYPRCSSWLRSIPRLQHHERQYQAQRCRVRVPVQGLLKRRFASTTSTSSASCLDLDEANDIMSQQHNHEDGPWKAMSNAVVAHYNNWLQQKQTQSSSTTSTKTFRVLDLACGRHGEPGSTIANALPLAMVQCTDSCALVMAAVPTSTNQQTPRIKAPPTNLSTSVVNMSDLSQFETNSIHAITCCYGYNLVPPEHLSLALEEAYRVLTPGGILVVVNWEQSSLRQIGRDVLAQAANGGNRIEDDNDSLFMAPQIAPMEPIYLSTASSNSTSGPDAWLQSCIKAGFGAGPTVSIGTYPFCLGNRPRLQFFVGTCTMHDELQKMGALGVLSSTEGGWSSLAEECFWTSIGKYDTLRDADGTMWLNGNVFQLSVSTK